MRQKRHLAAIPFLALTLFGLPAHAQTDFTILGSSGGPVSSPDRAQPSNLLTVNGRYTLIDVGDGAVAQLAKAGVKVFDLDNVLISHLHFDHVGGLLAVLGLRFQTNPQRPVQVYGPPGTQEMVAGLLQAMKPSMAAAYGGTDDKIMTPEELVVAHDVHGGDSMTLDGVTIHVAKNTHYSFKSGSQEDKQFESLSFRIDTPDRSIVYTGDTGQSPAVTQLAKGADLLVTEFIDLDAVLKQVRRTRPDLSDKAFEAVKAHLSMHHLTSKDIATMASAADVDKVVLTHLVGGATISEQDTARWQSEVQQGYDGVVEVGADLGRY